MENYSAHLEKQSAQTGSYTKQMRYTAFTTGTSAAQSLTDLILTGFTGIMEGGGFYADKDG